MQPNPELDKTVKKYFMITMLALFIITVFLLVVLQPEEPQGTLTPLSATPAQSEIDQYRSNFVSGCTGSGATTSQCTCMVDGLQELNPDMLTSSATRERLSTGDFTTAELTVILGCD